MRKTVSATEREPRLSAEPTERGRRPPSRDASQSSALAPKDGGLIWGIRRVARLSSPERALLVSAVFTLALLRVALWITPARWLLRKVLGRKTGGGGRSGVEPALIGRAVRRAARLVPGATCLPQALATIWLAAARGYASSLRIGVKRGEAGDLMAHAWVEHEGRILVGDIGVAQFAVLPGLEGALWLR